VSINPNFSVKCVMYEREIKYEIIFTPKNNEENSTLKLNLFFKWLVSVGK